jgi:hypothetical protein
MRSTPWCSRKRLSSPREEGFSEEVRDFRVCDQATVFSVDRSVFDAITIDEHGSGRHFFDKREIELAGLPDVV